MKTRIYFLDNLRTFLILLVILLHTGMNYARGMDAFWIINDSNKWNALSLINMYIDQFVMYLMFFISGYFIPISLKAKTTFGFVKSKVRRIFIPWLIAIFTLIPAYKAIYLFSRGLPQEEWYTYFHTFFRSGVDQYVFSNNPTQSWLWFLPVLFIFQIAYLALSKLNLLSFKISLKNAILITIGVGLVYSMTISELGLKGWAHTYLVDIQRERLLSYFLVFLIGSLCYKLDVFSQPKNKKYYIIANVVLSVAMTVFTVIALNFFFNMINPDRNYFIITEFFDRCMYYLSSLLTMGGFVYVLIHVFRSKLNKTNPTLSELNKNSYSVYIIHIIVIGLLGLCFLNLNMPGVIKFILVTILTFVLSNLFVSTYRELIQKQIRMKTIFGIILCIGLVSIAYYGNCQNQAKEVSAESQANKPDTPIHTAIVMGDLETVKAHIEAGTNINEAEPYENASPLMTATTFNKTEIALYLIEAGANVNYKKKDGSTPLHIASFFARTEIVKALLHKGADTSIRDAKGTLPINIVQAPFEMLKPIYDQIGGSLSSMGLKLDYERIKKARLEILELLK